MTMKIKLTPAERFRLERGYNHFSPPGCPNYGQLVEATLKAEGFLAADGTITSAGKEVLETSHD